MRQPVCAVTRREDLNWFHEAPEVSVKLIRRTGILPQTPILDIGGGSSSVADHLRTEGFLDVTVLDFAASRKPPPKCYGLWHDRAVLQFLVHPSEQEAYAHVLRSVLARDGWAIIGGFAPGGPIRRSGVDVVQHDAISLGRLLGDEFRLMETHGAMHATPWGADQAFRHHIFCRTGA